MATVQRNIDYCITVSFNDNGKLLQCLHNRAARIITDDFDWNSSGITIVNDLGWLNICQRRD